MRILGGAVAVLVISAIGGVAGQLVGHWLGKDAKNLALQSALIGIVASALLTVFIVSLTQHRLRSAAETGSLPSVP
jgi:hypothetical protein